MCPSAWLSSYLLPLYKGKGPLSEPDSYRGVALQCVVLKLYTYILNHRIGDWAETEGVIPDQQHGFRNNRSTITAIKLLTQYVSEALATPKTPLYVTYVDFRKAFDSVDRSLMLCKLKVVGLPGQVIRAIWPIVRENFVQITTAECLSNSVTQNVGLAQGECLSPLLYSIFTHDLPAVIEGEGVKTLLYADDLAICARDLVSMQEAMNRLHAFCTDNKLAVNVGKTKSVKFRRGGPLRKSDVLYYEGRRIEFVPNFTYLGVVMQTKGGYSGHIQNLKRKGISACTRVALRLPLTSMSLQSLERLLCTVILPSCTYGLALYESQMKECDFYYLDVVQGRLVKAWFGVSKFCSTTALREAIRWKRASEVVFCQLRHGARMSSFVVGEDTQSIPFGNHHIRRCMGMWLSNGLHHLWCGAGQCYFVSEECACKFCGCAGVDKFHLLRCEWASCEQMNMDNIQQIVKVLHACNRHT